MSSTWRTRAAVIINHVIRETHSTDMHVLKARLRDAYPFGVKNYWPYKVWCDEVNRQLGLKPPLKRGGRRPEPVPEEQGRLFT